MNIDYTLMSQELECDEGRRNRPYKDSVGNWTIGVGHLLGRTCNPNTYWDDKRVDFVLAADIQSAYNRLQNAPYRAAYNACNTDPRRRALVNMSFNLGDRLGEFQHSLGLVASGLFEAAANHLRQSLWYSQVGDRAERVVRQLENG